VIRINWRRPARSWPRDASTGGTIDGMIAGAERGLKMSDARTKIVPGHGPLADRAALTAYRDVLTTIRNRVRKAKRAGQPLQEAQASKPTAQFDAKWGGGMLPPDAFVALVYETTE
jgi:glyoxylase-like metal-dependent hydrolase (beta-lactamase superfamily II)